MKKITLGLLAPVVLATPLLTAISCGGEADKLQLAASYTGKTHSLTDSHITVTAPVAAIPDDPNTPDANESVAAVPGSINLTKDVLSISDVASYTQKITKATTDWLTGIEAAYEKENESMLIDVTKVFMSTFINETFILTAHYVSYVKELLANEKFVGAIATSEILKFKGETILDTTTISGHSNIKSVIESASFNLATVIGTDLGISASTIYSYNAIIVNKTTNLLDIENDEDTQEAMDMIGISNDKFVAQYVKTGITSASIFNLAELIMNNDDSMQ